MTDKNFVHFLVNKYCFLLFGGLNLPILLILLQLIFLMSCSTNKLTQALSYKKNAGSVQNQKYVEEKDQEDKILFVMTSNKLHAGTFLLSKLKKGGRKRISYIQNGTPVKIPKVFYGENITELIGGSHKNFLKIKTYSGLEGFIARENLIGLPQSYKNIIAKSLFLIKKPYAPIVGYYGNKLTRTQNTLILGKKFQNLIYAQAWSDLRSKAKSINVKFDYDPFMIDALPLASFPNVTDSFVQLDKSNKNNCRQQQNWQLDQMLKINAKVLIISKNFNCINNHPILKSITIQHKKNISSEIVKIDNNNREEKYLVPSLTSNSLYRYSATNSIDFFSLDKQIKDILYLKFRQAMIDLSDIELYVLIDHLKALYFDYSSTKSK